MLYLFWNDKASDLVDFYMAIESWRNAGLVHFEADETHGTAVAVADHITEQFIKLAKSFNLEVEQ